MKYCFLLSLCCTVLAAAPYVRNCETFSSYRSCQLESENMVLRFAPDQLGRLASVKLKKSHTELTGEFKLSRYTETPLFYLESGNFQGIRELFWRRNISGISPVQIKEKKDCSITFEAASYGGTNLGLCRKVYFEKNAFVINFESVFINNGKKDEKISVWLNLQGAPPATPVIPVLERGSVPLRGMIELYDRPFIFTGAGGNSNLPPAEEWAGFRLTGRKTVWVLESRNIRKGGFYYSWGNQDHRAPIRTVEPVLPEISLKPGEKSAPFNYRVLVFPGLENINALLAETALEIRMTGHEKMELFFCNASEKKSAENVELILRGKGGKVIFRKSFRLPAVKAGNVISFKENFPGTALSGTLKSGGKSVQVYFEKEK